MQNTKASATATVDTTFDGPRKGAFKTAEERAADAQMREFYGRGDFRYAITPPGWDVKRYGKAPVIGIVHADNEFLAERLAYDRGIVGTQSARPGITNLGEVRKFIQPAPSTMIH